MTMQVLYILPQDSGGLPHYAAGLANAVTEHADVVVMKPTTTTADDLFSDDIQIYEVFDSMDIATQSIYSLDINPRQMVSAFLSYRNLKLIHEIDPDIVHNTARMFPQVQVFLRRYGITKAYPYIETYHEVFSLSLSDPLFLLIELLNRTVSAPMKDRLIVHTQTQKEKLHRQLGHSSDINVIPHGAFDFFASGKPEARSNTNHLLFFGNIIPQKGLQTLVEAIPIVQAKIPDVTLTIAGSGNLSEETWEVLQTYPHCFDVRNQFIPNEDVGQLFTHTTAVVLPYAKQWADGHSGPLTIAFSYGKPVIATDVGDFRRLIEESGSGLVVSPDDPAQLADAIVRVLEDADLRSSMRENSLQMADELSWETVAERHLEVYNDLLF